jgi:hypothetical protein
MMTRVSRSIFAGAALALLLVGCQKGDAPAISSNGASPQPVTNASPVPQVPNADQPVPATAKAFAT